MGCTLVNRFQIDGDNFIFIEEGSDNFLYVDVKNGEMFYGTFYEDESMISASLLEK